jgi:hypothetical protein
MWLQEGERGADGWKDILIISDKKIQRKFGYSD